MAPEEAAPRDGDGDRDTRDRDGDKDREVGDTCDTHEDDEDPAATRRTHILEQ
ncbi:hypothetical protein HGM15179_021976, partial [Zosterops borbonicus]